MVWKTMKGRRLGNKSVVPTNSSQNARQLKSCMKNGTEKIDYTYSLIKSGVDSSSASRDHSIRSGKSILSVFSAVSNRSKETPPNAEDNIRSNTSGSSGESRLSRNSFPRSSQNSIAITTTASSAPVDKAVRFGDIHIREHERVVGDNPSCSTGPPLAIGWGHGDTQTVQLDAFEEARQYRRKRMVLSRQQREELLLNWGISFEDIIDAIRANIKVKNQRRQTVTNLGKIERLEEAFESATRKLKQVLFRKSTGDKVKQLQEQADVAAKTLRALDLAHGKMIKKMRQEDAPAEMKAETTDLENIDLEVTLQKTPSDSKLSVTSDLDESHTLMSGLSLGNSSSASIREMEQFYRDLELEMFGDMPLPDMVGETLEVPGLAIPEEDRVYYDPPSLSGFEEPPSVTGGEYDVRAGAEHKNGGSPPLPLHLMAQGGMRVHTVGMEIIHPEGVMPSDPRVLKPRGVDVSQPRDSEPSTPPYPHGSIPAGVCLFHDDPVMAIRMGQTAPPQVRIRDPPNSQDKETIEQHRANITRAYLSQTVTAMEQRYLHPSLTPPPPYRSQYGSDAFGPDGSMEPENNSRSHPGSPSKKERNSRRSSKRRDGPEICHIPLFKNVTPTHFMEGGDESIGSHSDPITITEDDGMQHLPRAIERPHPGYAALQSFSSSLY